MLYAQHNQERERGRKGHGYDCSRYRGSGKTMKREDKRTNKNCRGQGCGRGRGDHSNRPDVECYNCEKYGHHTNDCYVKKKAEENANLVEDVEEVLKTSKALEAQMAEIEDAKNKALVVAHVIKDELFNPPIDEDSYMVVSGEDMQNPISNSMIVNLG